MTIDRNIFVTMGKRFSWTRAVLVFGVAFFSFHLASAEQIQYIPIEDVPGFEGEADQDFLTYLTNLFVALIWIAGISAMFMIMLGGFWYVTSAGNTARISKAKDLMWDAVVGLVLALGSWLLLHTIDPNLTKLHFQTLDWKNNQGSGPASGGTNPPPPSDGSVPQDVQTAAKNVLAKCSVSGSKDSCGGTAQKDFQDLAAGNPMTISCTKEKKTPPLVLMQMLSHLCDTNGKSVQVNYFGGGEHTANSKHYQGRAVDLDGGSMADLLQKVKTSASAVGMPTAGIFCDNGKKSACNVANHVHAGL